MQKEMTTFVALTLDVDPDANRAVGGREDCVSAPFRGRVSVKAVRGGLERLRRICGSLNLPATVFWEARTLDALAITGPETVAGMAGGKLFEHACHGWRHEDYTGELTHLPLTAEDVKKHVTESARSILGRLGVQPAGFRAPYCRVNERILRIISASGYSYDASATLDARAEGVAGAPIRPYVPCSAAENFLEIPLLIWRDMQGEAMSGYLWRLMEGSREPQSYVRMALEIAEHHPGSLIQFAVHPWHLSVNEKGEPFPDAERPAAAIFSLLTALRRRRRLCFTTVGGYLRRQIPFRHASPP